MHFRCTNDHYLDLCSCFALIVFLMYYDSKGSVALLYGAVDQFTVSDCGIF